MSKSARKSRKPAADTVAAAVAFSFATAAAAHAGDLRARADAIAAEHAESPAAADPDASEKTRLEVLNRKNHARRDDKIVALQQTDPAAYLLLDRICDNPAQHAAFERLAMYCKDKVTAVASALANGRELSAVTKNNADRAALRIIACAPEASPEINTSSGKRLKTEAGATAEEIGLYMTLPESGCGRDSAGFSSATASSQKSSSIAALSFMSLIERRGGRFYLSADFADRARAIAGMPSDDADGTEA